MGKIYLITNIKNKMQYVGQTTGCVAQRFAQHIDASYRTNNKNKRTNFYKDIVESGEDVYNIFQYQILEECDNKILNEREIYWIKNKQPEYNWSHRKEFIDNLYSKEICELYQEGYTITELREKYQCRHNEIKNILINNNIEIKKSRPSKKNRKAVYHFDVYGNLINKYPCAAECGNDLNITRCNVRMCALNNTKYGYLKYSCNGEYVSYYKEQPYIFKLIDHNINDIKLLKTKRALEIEVEKRVGKFITYSQICRKGRKTIYGIEVDKTEKEKYDETIS